MTSIRNLAFDGTGVDVIAYSGALTALNAQSEFSLKNIEKLSGASSGAVSALLVCLGYNTQDIEKIAFDTDFSVFAGGDFLSNFKRLLQEDGYYDHTELYRTIKSFIARAPQMEACMKQFDRKDADEITFGDLKKFGYKDLYIITTVVCLINGRAALAPFVFCAETAAHTSVALALLASVSIPGIFAPVHLIKVSDGCYLEDPNGHAYIDGGATPTLLPVTVFDQPLPKDPIGKPISRCERSHFWTLLLAGFAAEQSVAEYKYNEQTLGLQVNTDFQIEEFYQRSKDKDKSLGKPIHMHPLSYITPSLRDILDEIIFKHRYRTFIECHGVERTIFIDCQNVGSLNFRIKPYQKVMLWNFGYHTVKETYIKAREYSSGRKPSVIIPSTLFAGEKKAEVAQSEPLPAKGCCVIL